jgi:hypothetical protein
MRRELGLLATTFFMFFAVLVASLVCYCPSEGFLNLYITLRHQKPHESYAFPPSSPETNRNEKDQHHTPLSSHDIYTRLEEEMKRLHAKDRASRALTPEVRQLDNNR